MQNHHVSCGNNALVTLCLILLPVCYSASAVVLCYLRSALYLVWLQVAYYSISLKSTNLFPLISGLFVNIFFFFFLTVPFCEHQTVECFSFILILTRISENTRSIYLK